MNFMKKSLTYTRIELLVILRDRKASILILLFPIVFAIIYGLVLGAFVDPSSNSFIFAIPSTLATMVTFTCVNGGAGSMARNRENKQFARLLLSNIRPSNIVVGKGIYFLIITCVQTTLLLGTVSIFFEFSVSKLPIIILITGVFSIFAVSIGTCAANFSDTEDGAEHFTVLISFVMLVLGSWFPIG